MQMYQVMDLLLNIGAVAGIIVIARFAYLGSINLKLAVVALSGMHVLSFFVQFQSMEDWNYLDEWLVKIALQQLLFWGTYLISWIITHRNKISF